MLSRRTAAAVSLVINVLREMGAGVSWALGETHPFLFGVGFLSRRSRIIAVVLPFVVAVLVTMGVGASPALAETHPFLSSFGSFTNPNGIAVDEATGDVYVADLGTNTVSKFDASGTPVNFACGVTCSTYVTGNAISGTAFGESLSPWWGLLDCSGSCRWNPHRRW